MGRFLAGHERVLREPAPQTRLIRLGASSVDVDVTAYVSTRDAEEFLAIQEDLLLRILDLVARCGTGMALPSQRLLLGRDPVVRVTTEAQEEDPGEPAPERRS